MTRENQPSLFDEDTDDSKGIDGIELVVTKTDLSQVEVIRSKRRKRNVTAYRESDKTVVMVPARMAKRDIDVYVAELVDRLDARDERAGSQSELEKRARTLSKKYLEVDLFKTHRVPVSIRWVTNQNSRWGSCSPSDGAIRLSHRLSNMPQFVIDSVIVHELIHLLVADHGPKFYELMNKFPEHEKAKAYLDGYSFAEQHLKND
ncbi:MAG: M48 family metallopeptidase [Actinomycetes bacterium]